jgi:hypothetical protein
MFRSLFRSRKPRRSACVKKNRRVRLQLEALEERAVPTIVFMPHYGVETLAHGSTNDGMQHPTVNLVFSGSYWNTMQGQQDEATLINSTKTILSGPYLSGLTQYGSDGKANFGLSWTDPATVPTQPTTARLQGFLQNSITNHNAGPGFNDWQHAPIYVVVSDPDSSAQFVGGWNGQGTYAYYYWSQDANGFYTYYHPANMRMVWLGTSNSGTTGVQKDWFTLTLSHELAETISDPDSWGIRVIAPSTLPASLTGDSTNGQIGDFEPEPAQAHHYGYRLQGEFVQPYWSVRDQAYIVPDGNSQNFYLYPIWNDTTTTFTGTYNLNVIGDQLGVNYADNIQIGGGANASVTMNNQSAMFDSGAINTINVNTAGGQNTVKVFSLPSAVTLNLDSSGFNGFDQVLIGDNGSLAGIQGTVNIANHSGQSSVTIDDTNDGARNITLTDHSVTYSGLTTINYTAAYLVNGYEYGVSTLVLDAGSGSQIDVLSVGGPTDTEIYLYWNLLNKVYGPAASQVHVHIYWLVAQ